MDIYKKLESLNFPKGEYVVIGGSMTAHNIRDAHDLDILVTPNLYQTLLDNREYKQCVCEQCVRTSRLMLKGVDVDILPNFMFGNYIGDTRSLIENADVINGYPFIKLSEFIKFKKELGKPKDIEDIRLMNEYLEHNK
jgi:hypothetical protein